MIGTKRRLSSRIALCAALVSGVLVTGVPSALADCETVWVDVYEVQVEVGRARYHVGDTAVVDATVTRDDTGMPVADAMFVAILTDRDEGWAIGWNETDAQGHATARMKLRKNRLDPGPIGLRAVAYEMTADASCAQVIEYGEETRKKAFALEP